MCSSSQCGHPSVENASFICLIQGPVEYMLPQTKKQKSVSDCISSARGAGESIKSRTPAEMLGWGPRPGVERSGTPGAEHTLISSLWNGRQREQYKVPDTNHPTSINSSSLGHYRPLHGLCFSFRHRPGVPLRSTQALCCH